MQVVCFAVYKLACQVCPLFVELFIECNIAKWDLVQILTTDKDCFW